MLLADDFVMTLIMRRTVLIFSIEYEVQQHLALLKNRLASNRNCNRNENTYFVVLT